jgi:hypothetical protein
MVIAEKAPFTKQQLDKYIAPEIFETLKQVSAVERLFTLVNLLEEHLAQTPEDDIENRAELTQLIGYLQEKIHTLPGFKSS